MSFHYTFLNENEEEQKFACNLRCNFCTATTRSGRRCRNRTCMHLPFCYLHLAENSGIEVRKSNIENAGMGVFALRDFKPNEVVCEYLGEIIDDKKLTTRYGETTAPYAISVTENKIIDAACQRGIGSVINGSTTFKRSNVRFVAYRGKINIRVRKSPIRGLKQGEELLVYYGNDYRFDEGGHKTLRRKLSKKEERI